MAKQAREGSMKAMIPSEEKRHTQGFGVEQNQSEDPTVWKRLKKPLERERPPLRQGPAQTGFRRWGKKTGTVVKVVDPVLVQ